MDATFATIAAIAAAAAVLAFLGLLASSSVRAGQESRLREFLLARGRFAEKLLEIRKRRVERLRGLRGRLETRPRSLEKAVPAGGGGTGERPPVEEPSVSDPAAISKQVKENPAQAASILKSFLMPKNGS